MEILICIAKKGARRKKGAEKHKTIIFVSFYRGVVGRYRKTSKKKKRKMKKINFSSHSKNSRSTKFSRHFVLLRRLDLMALCYDDGILEH